VADLDSPSLGQEVVPVQGAPASRKHPHPGRRHAIFTSWLSSEP